MNLIKLIPLVVIFSVPAAVQAATINSIAYSNPGTGIGPCGEASSQSLRGPDRLSFSRPQSIIVGGECGFNARARAELGSVGLQLSMNAGTTNTGENGGSSNIAGSASTRFELEFNVPEDHIPGTAIPITLNSFLSASAEALLFLPPGGVNFIRGASSRLDILARIRGDGFDDRGRIIPVQSEIRRRLNASAISTDIDDLVPGPDTVFDSDSFQGSFAPNSIMVNPERRVIVEFAFFGRAGLTVFTDTAGLSRVSAFNSLGFSPGELVADLPEGYSVSDTDDGSIVNGLYIGLSDFDSPPTQTTPEPTVILPLLGGGLIALLGAIRH